MARAYDGVSGQCVLVWWTAYVWLRVVAVTKKKPPRSPANLRTRANRAIDALGSEKVFALIAKATEPMLAMDDEQDDQE